MDPTYDVGRFYLRFVAAIACFPSLCASQLGLQRMNFVELMVRLVRTWIHDWE